MSSCSRAAARPRQAQASGGPLAPALAAVLLWSTVATAFKLALAHLAPVQLLFYASLVSCLSLGLILAWRGGITALRHLTWREIRPSVLYGFLNPFLYYMLLFAAYDRLPAQEAQALNYTWSITLALLAVPVLGHRLRGLDAAAILVSYVGVLVIATRGEVASLRFSDATGAALALASTVVWASYWLLNARDRRDPVLALLLNFAFGLALCLPVALLTSGLAVSWQGLAGAAWVGVFEMGLTFVLWLTAMRRTTSTARLSTLAYLSPVLSLLFIGLVLGEVIQASTLAGLGLILAGQGVQRLGQSG